MTSDTGEMVKRLARARSRRTPEARKICARAPHAKRATQGDGVAPYFHAPSALSFPYNICPASLGTRARIVCWRAMALNSGLRTVDMQVPRFAFCARPGKLLSACTNNLVLMVDPLSLDSAPPTRSTQQNSTLHMGKCDHNLFYPFVNSYIRFEHYV